MTKKKKVKKRKTTKKPKPKKAKLITRADVRIVDCSHCGGTGWV